MKKILIFLIFVLVCAVPCLKVMGAFTTSIDDRSTYKHAYVLTGKPKDKFYDWCQEVEDRIDGTTANNFLYCNPDAEPDQTNEGTIYYDSDTDGLYYRNASTWVTIAASTSSTLDEAYDAGATIDVDGNAVTLTTSDGDNNVVLAINQQETTNNNDGVTISQAGSGDGIQITTTEATGVNMRLIGAASQTTSMGVYDAATSNWDGADNIGMLHLSIDDPFIHAGASAIAVHNSGQPITAAEGFLARFVSTGTARTNAYAVEIEVPATQPALASNGIVAVSGQDNPGAVLVQVTGIDTTGNTDTMSIDHSGSGNGLYIDSNEADSQCMTLEPHTNSTVACLEVDGDAHGWDGADNVGMVHLRNDDPGIHAGATLLLVDDSSQPITAAEGFLARFVATGTARTNAYAVEIEVPATQPALASNGIVAISGQDNPGASLVQVTGIDTTGNSDTITVTHSGSGDGIQISPQETDSRAMSVTAVASSTVSNVILDAATNNWSGADNVGLLHINSDAALAHAGASLLQVVHATGQPITSGEGFLARFVSTGTARTNAHAVEIETTNTQPTLMLNNLMTITGADSAGTLLAITGNDATGNTDTVTINGEGTGDALQITCDDADSVALKTIAAASQTTSVAVIDGATSNWDGADNVGMLHLTQDTPNVHTGASMLYVTSSGQPIASAEGFLARFVDTGTARTDAYAVEIETTNTTPCLYLNNQMTIAGADSAGTLLDITGNDATGNTDTVTINGEGTGSALKITCDDADSVALTTVAAASQTTSVTVIDGSTSNWDGADNVGMLHISTDDPVVHTGASLLQVIQTGQPIAASEGHLARFVSSGTARTDAYAVEIETTNTTPALQCNNQVTISGADSAGTLFDITGIDTTGNTDTMTIDHSGSGNGLYIDANEADSQCATFEPFTNSTVAALEIDGDAAGWQGADNIGMVHLRNDTTHAHAGATMLLIDNSGQPIASAEGFGLRILDSGAAQSSTYAMEIESTNNEALHVDSGKVVIDETLRATLGYQCGVGETLTANSDSGAGSTCDEDVRVFNVTGVNADANDWIVLPDSIIGRQVVILCNAGSNFEIRTPAATNDTINNVDSDGSAEYLATDTDMILFTCHTATGWIGESVQNDSTHRAAVTPD